MFCGFFNSAGNLILLLYFSPEHYIVEIDNNGNIVRQCKMDLYSFYFNMVAYPDGIYLQYNNAGDVINYGNCIIKLDNK